MFVLASFEDKSGCRILDLSEFIPVHMNSGQMSVICTSKHEQWPNAC